MIYVPAEVMPASVFVALHSRASGQSSLQALSAIQCWLDRESSYKRLSQLALDLVASSVSQVYVERLFSLCSDLTARKRNSTSVPVWAGISETEPSHSALNAVYLN